MQKPFLAAFFLSHICLYASDAQLTLDNHTQRTYNFVFSHPSAHRTFEIIAESNVEAEHRLSHEVISQNRVWDWRSCKFYLENRTRLDIYVKSGSGTLLAQEGIGLIFAQNSNPAVITLKVLPVQDMKPNFVTAITSSNARLKPRKHVINQIRHLIAINPEWSEEYRKTKSSD